VLLYLSILNGPEGAAVHGNTFATNTPALQEGRKFSGSGIWVRSEKRWNFGNGNGSVFPPHLSHGGSTLRWRWLIERSVNQQKEESVSLPRTKLATEAVTRLLAHNSRAWSYLTDREFIAPTTIATIDPKTTTTVAWHWNTKHNNQRTETAPRGVYKWSVPESGWDWQRSCSIAVLMCPFVLD